MIEIREIRDDLDGSIVTVIIGRLDLDAEGNVVFHGVKPDLARFLMNYAAWSVEANRPVEWTEGRLWLDALPANLHGSLIQAAEVPDETPQ